MRQESDGKARRLSEVFEEFLDGEPRLPDDRPKRPTRHVLAMERHRHPDHRTIRVFEKVVASGDVVHGKSGMRKRPG